MANSGCEHYRNRALALAAIGLMGVLGFTGVDTPAAAAAGDLHTAPVSDIDQLASAPRPEAEFQILVGELLLRRDDTLAAAKAYVKAVKRSRDPALAQRAMQIALAVDRPDLAYQAARNWARSAANDAQAQRAAVRLAFVNEDPDGLQTFAARLVASADSPRDGYGMLAELLAGRPGQVHMVLRVMRKLAAAASDQAAAQYALGRLALSYDRVDMAAAAADKAAADAPDWPDAGLLRAATEIQQGHAGAAEKRIDALEGSPRQRAGYQVALARMLLQAGANAKGLVAFKRAVAIDDDFAAARYGLGLVALSQGDLDTADAQFEWIYDSGTHAGDAAFYRGVIAEKRDDNEQAIDWYSKVDDGGHEFEARVRAAELSYREGDLDEARRQLDALARQHPSQRSRLRAVEGSLLVDAGQFKKALALYDKALESAPGDSDLLYSRSLVYEKLRRIDDAEADLKAILSRDADNTEALNALGYILTNHSTDYARAERYIRKSLKTDPDNPAVLDSLGWVEYKRGHLESARKRLEQAYKASPDPEIAAHLGEVRWAQGDHDAARTIWHKAQAEHPDNAVLKQTIKRLAS